MLQQGKTCPVPNEVRGMHHAGELHAAMEAVHFIKYAHTHEANLLPVYTECF